MELPATTVFTRLLSNKFRISVYAAIVCFACYTCIFAFRKAFNVAPYGGFSIAGIEYKVWLVITQVFGYMLSKFYGIKFISELKRVNRGYIILILVGISWIAWLLFALLPPPYNFWCLFFNGFPLGMLWGVVFSYVEGRRATDFIGAALAVSFIFASGLAKSTAQWVMNGWGVNEYWMPFIVGLIFMAPLLIFVFLMEKIPQPDKEDIEHRTERMPMTAEKRREFVQQFLTGIILLVIIYILVTILREIRDSFMADMWRESGEVFQPSVFAKTETTISLVILIIIASLVLVKNNFRAFFLAQGIMLTGFILCGIITWMFLQKQVNTYYWTTFTGLGLYMVYIPYNSMLFDRLLASFKYAGTVGFLIYVADAFGYLGSVAVLLSKTIFKLQINWLNFYTGLVSITSIAGVIAVTLSVLYFMNKRKTYKLNLTPP